ncbi:MAG: GIY-YIG nuclease family protein, partial [Patescibacteria group bacterium]
MGILSITDHETGVAVKVYMNEAAAYIGIGGLAETWNRPPSELEKILESHSSLFYNHKIVARRETSQEIALDYHGAFTLGRILDDRYGSTCCVWLKKHNAIMTNPLQRGFLHVLFAENPKPDDKLGCIYFARSTEGDGPIKIGFTRDLKMRMGSLSNSSAVPLSVIARMPGTLEDEKKLHCRFSAFRLHGEWFT